MTRAARTPLSVAAIMVVAVGAGLGAVVRHLVELTLADQGRSLMVINLTGSLAIGVLVGLGLASPGSPGRARHRVHLLLGPGFLGGYTTFSTLMVEMITDGSAAMALLLVLQVLGGVLLAMIGLSLGRTIRR